MRKRFILSVSQFHKFAEIAVRALVERDKKCSLEKMLPETEKIFPNAVFDFCEVHATLSKGVCYSHFGNGVRNGAEAH